MSSSSGKRRSVDMDDFQPVKKKAKKAVVPAERFKTPTSDEDMTRLCKAYVSPNTKKNTDWALRLFSEWRAERNKNISDLWFMQLQGRGRRCALTICWRFHSQSRSIFGFLDS